jgi:hypothetical protein
MVFNPITNLTSLNKPENFDDADKVPFGTSGGFVYQVDFQTITATRSGARGARADAQPK